MINISVVIPLYNKAMHIERTLWSVFKQNKSPYEIIVINDGSTDEGEVVVEKFLSKGVRLITQINSGVSCARNRGIKESKGNIITFLDADDEWKPNFIDEITALVTKYPNCGLYATSHEIIDKDGIINHHNFDIEWSGNGKDGVISNYFKAAINYPINSSSVAIRREVLTELNGFVEGEIVGEDTDLWLRIALSYPMAWSENISSSYHQDSTNRAIGTARWNNEPAISKTGREAILTNKIPFAQLESFKEYIALHQLFAARDCLINSNKKVAKLLLRYCSTTKRRKQWLTWYLVSMLPSFVPSYLLHVKKTLKKLNKNFLPD